MFPLISNYSRAPRYLQPEFTRQRKALITDSYRENSRVSEAAGERESWNYRFACT